MTHHPGLLNFRLSEAHLFLACDPTHGLFGKASEGHRGKLKVFLLCVFKFVVAEAVERLREHHHGGNAGARDFCGVV
jgi:hypothetical protein